MGFFCLLSLLGLKSEKHDVWFGFVWDREATEKK